jgi:glycosyltransferase involved in cell wall biosynthesis
MANNSPLTLFIVVPCYNEEDVLPEISKRLQSKLEKLISAGKISTNSKIVFVADESTDSTWELIETYHSIMPERFGGVKMSKKLGHQNALLCGLLATKDYCDAIITMDSDLQDDIEAIDEMVEYHRNGCEIVYGVRVRRKTDRLFKRITALAFYSFMRMLSVDIVYNHADYRLMGKLSLEALSAYKEVNIFLRGIVPLLGFKTGVVYYDRPNRYAGSSKYPLLKMLQFAFEGLTSFSIKPVRVITILGIILFCVSIIMLCYFISDRYIKNTAPGWASLICSVWAIGGLILLSIGIIGEYIGKIYLETKQRPRFFIEKLLIRR